MGKVLSFRFALLKQLAKLNAKAFKTDLDCRKILELQALLFYGKYKEERKSNASTRRHTEKSR